MPSRPTGSSPTPATASSPARRCSSALTAGPAARNAPPRRGPHVGAGDDGDRAVVGARHEAVEHVDAAPRPVPADRPQADVPALRRRRPAPADRRAVEEAVEVGLVVPDGEQRRAPQVGRRPGVAPRPVPSSRQKRKPGARRRRRRSVARRRHRGRPRGGRARGGTTRPGPSIGHAGTVRRAVRVAAAAVAGYLLGSIPVADLVGRRRRRRPARRRRPQPRLVERHARRSGGGRRCPVLVGDIAKGAAGAAIGRRRRPAAASGGSAVVGGGGGDGRPRLAAVRPLPRRPQRRHVRRRGRRAVAG